MADYLIAPSILSANFAALGEDVESVIAAGADIIQTEGGTSSRPLSPGILGRIEKASPSLAAAHTISENFSKLSKEVPLICASGLTEVTVPMAIAAGASGVGIGSAINKLDDALAMLAVVRRIRESMLTLSSIPLHYS